MDDDDAWQLVATHGSWREVEAARGRKVHAFTLVCYIQRKAREWLKGRRREGGYQVGDLVWVGMAGGSRRRRLTVLHERGKGEEGGSLLWIGKMGNRFDYLYDQRKVPTTVRILRLGMRGYEPRPSRG